MKNATRDNLAFPMALVSNVPFGSCSEDVVLAVE